MKRSALLLFSFLFVTLTVLSQSSPPARPGVRANLASQAMFNVRNYGATGAKSDDARPAIQSAIDACGKAGGGMVYLPPGQYTSGRLTLRSHVRFHIEAGATLFASPDPKAYSGYTVPSQAALFFGEGVENITIEGRGTVDGQAEYEWRPDDTETAAFQHKALMQSLGKSLLRSYPIDLHTRTIYPHLIYLGHSKDVRITGLSFLHSFSWTMALYACQRVVVDSVYIYTSLKDAVWADGIDLDGCQDVSIANSSIETGDDCIIFISTTGWGPALPCENITVTNCRLSSASAAIKFSEGNSNVIRNVVVNNCVITNTNRGFVFTITTGGVISDVIFSNITMDLNRFDWFWAGDAQPFYFRITRESEWNKEALKPGEPAPGKIRNVTIRNVIAHGKGSSLIDGHPESWIDGLTLENIQLFLATDPSAPFDTAVHALRVRWARNVTLKNVEVHWEKPALNQWQSALDVENVENLQLDNFAGRQAWPDRDVPAVEFNNVADAIVRNSRAEQGTGVFLKIAGSQSRDMYLLGNDFRHAKIPFQVASDVPADQVKSVNNIPAAP